MTTPAPRALLVGPAMLLAGMLLSTIHGGGVSGIQGETPGGPLTLLGFFLTARALHRLGRLGPDLTMPSDGTHPSKTD